MTVRAVNKIATGGGTYLDGGCEDGGMVEYGRTVGEGTEAAGGGSGGSGGVTDVGASAIGAAADAIDRVASLPPEMLLLLAVVVLVGFVVLRRAF